MWWSWILTGVGLLGFFFVGRKKWWAWYINIACQALWYAYAFVTEQYGFVVAATLYTIVFTQNARAWTKEHFREKRLATVRELLESGTMSANELRKIYGEKDD